MHTLINMGNQIEFPIQPFDLPATQRNKDNKQKRSAQPNGREGQG